MIRINCSLSSNEITDKTVDYSKKVPPDPQENVSFNAPSKDITVCFHLVGLNSQFCFENNQYSSFYRSVHFTPIWFSDGIYTPYFRGIDAWAPEGMLQIEVTDTMTMKGNLYDD